MIKIVNHESMAMTPDTAEKLVNTEDLVMRSKTCNTMMKLYNTNGSASNTNVQILNQTASNLTFANALAADPPSSHLQ